MSPDRLDKEKEDTGNIAQNHADQLFNRSGQPLDPDLQELEEGGGNLYASDKPKKKPGVDKDEMGLFNPDNQARTAIGSRINQFTSKLKLSSARNKILYGLLSLVGVSGVVILCIILFMIISGFGVGQVSVVIQNYGMYRVNRVGRAITTKVIQSDARLRSGPGLSTSVTPSSLRSKWQGFDINKVLATLEKEGKISYVRNGNVTTGIRVGNGDPIPIDRGGSTSTRAASFNQLQEALRAQLPEFENSKFVGKTANGIFERIRLERVRWTSAQLDELKSRFANKDIRAADNAEQFDKVRGSPDSGTNSNAEIEAARNAGDDAIDDVIASGDPDPVASVTPAQVDAIESTGRPLGRLGVAGQLAEGVSTVAAYSLCTIDGIVQSGRDSVSQNNDAAARDAGQLFTTYDQYKEGTINMQAVAAARANLGDFPSDQAGYQRAAYNADWKEFNQLPAVDRPVQDPETGWMKTFGDISDATNNIPAFGTFCDFINHPVGGFAFGIATGVAETAIVAALAPVTGGGSAAGAQGAKAAISEGIEAAIKTATKETVTVAIRRSLTNATGNFLEREAGDSVLRAVGRKLVKGAVAPQNLAVAGATVGMTYLLVKLAHSSSGLTYSGTSGEQSVNQKAAGTEVIKNDLGRSRYYGVPLEDHQVLTYHSQQIAEHKAEQQKKSFYARMLDIRNPYSAATQLAMQSPYSPGTAKTLALKKLNPLVALNPTHNGTLKFVTTAFRLDKYTHAQQTEEDVELLVDGVQQWGLTPEEEELIKTDEAYSPDSIMIWAETDEGREAVETYQERFGICFAPDTQMSDILLDDDLKQKCISDLIYTNKSDPNLFKWRLNNAYIAELEDYKELETVTEDPAGDRGGDQPEGVVGIEETAVTTKCGNEIRVHKSIVSLVDDLCTAASGAGITLSGGGWRDNAQQIALREAHGCGGAQLYNPDCNAQPPTAVPGRSRHERGLAIDFDNCATRSTACFQWLAGNAASFGLINLPSEPWHWSTDGG